MLVVWLFPRSVHVIDPFLRAQGESGGVDPDRWSALSKSGDLPKYVVDVGKHSLSC